MFTEHSGGTLQTTRELHEVKSQNRSTDPILHALDLILHCAQTNPFETGQVAIMASLPLANSAASLLLRASGSSTFPKKLGKPTP